MPLEVRVIDDLHLTIAWSDGHRSYHTFNELRKNCPCALCENVRNRQSGLIVLQGPVVTKVTPNLIKPVGRYAITFEWSDSHDSGIYTYEYLRGLCECEDCKLPSK
ncbi:MAG: hypothetical protein CMO12_01380 [Thaumarchaeota archaeon]|nr:hypothetical protein [Nitrososphaerota archaeon]